MDLLQFSFKDLFKSPFDNTFKALYLLNKNPMANTISTNLIVIDNGIMSNNNTKNSPPPTYIIMLVKYTPLTPLKDAGEPTLFRGSNFIKPKM